MESRLPMQVSLGPVQYFWTKQQLVAFYDAAATSDADIIYLGETICSKRRQLDYGDWMDIARQLATAGKQVVIATLALLEAESELGSLRRYCHNGEFLVEANDMAAVNLLRERQLPFVAGPTLNAYNVETLKVLHRAGMQRWVIPVEMSRDTLQAAVAGLQAAGLAGLQIEMLAYGHLPLAYSARCFTARAHNLAKDQCGFVCLAHPRGLRLDTQEDEPLFVLNGIQIQSAGLYNLCDVWPELQASGIDIMRINPIDPTSIATASELHRALQENRMPALQHPQAPLCNGFWRGEAGMAWQPPAS